MAYRVWNVSARFRGRCVGTMPKDHKTLERYVESIGAGEDYEFKEKLEGEIGAVPNSEEMTVTFKRDDTGLYLEDRQIKAAYKEAASRLGFTNQNQPGRQFFQHSFFVDPPRIYFGLTEISGSDTLYGVVMTAQGPRNIVRNFDYVEGVEINWTVKAFLGASELSEEQHSLMLEIMQENGIGGQRSQGFGKFDVTNLEHVGVVGLPKFVPKARKKKSDKSE